jgi:hypothetical protein
MQTMYVSVRDGHLRWRSPERWTAADEQIAGIVRIVVASNSDLEIEFLGGHAPLRLKARKEYRAEDLKALAHLSCHGERTLGDRGTCIVEAPG